MSQRLPAVHPRKLIGVLKKKGWQHVRTTGSHYFFAHPDSPNLISVPFHPRDLKRGLLAGVLDDAGISREEFLRLL